MVHWKKFFILLRSFFGLLVLVLVLEFCPKSFVCLTIETNTLNSGIEGHRKQQSNGCLFTTVVFYYSVICRICSYSHTCTSGFNLVLVF